MSPRAARGLGFGLSVDDMVGLRRGSRSLDREALDLAEHAVPQADAGLERLDCGRGGLLRLHRIVAAEVGHQTTRQRAVLVRVELDVALDVVLELAPVELLELELRQD